MKLEVIMLPVADVDKSIAFYRDKMGFILDHDVQPGNGMRIVQLTPQGSACSIVFGTGIGALAAPGSVKGTHLVVDDIAMAHAKLKDSGVTMGDINDMGSIKYAHFSDPDSNTWELQEIPRDVLSI